MLFTCPGMLGGAGGPASQALSRCPVRVSCCFEIARLDRGSCILSDCQDFDFIFEDTKSSRRYILLVWKACSCTDVFKPERCQDPSSACDMDSLTCRCKVRLKKTLFFCIYLGYLGITFVTCHVGFSVASSGKG